MFETKISPAVTLYASSCLLPALPTERVRWGRKPIHFLDSDFGIFDMGDIVVFYDRD